MQHFALYAVYMQQYAAAEVFFGILKNDFFFYHKVFQIIILSLFEALFNEKTNMLHF